MRRFEYLRPATAAQAVAALRASDGEAWALAGGMTLIPSLKHGLLAPSLFVDLRGVLSFQGIRNEADQLAIGAMTTHHEVANSELVRARLPALARLAGGIGDVQVRHRGTIGGSIANNDPSADYPAACLALDATIVTTQRELQARDFFTGLFATALQPGELITTVRFASAVRAAYVKFASQASRYATVGVFVAESNGAVKVAVTGAGKDGVFRAPMLEAALAERFAPEKLPLHDLLDEALISDLHATAAYRSHLINVVARRAVGACLGLGIKAPVRHGGAVAF